MNRRALNGIVAVTISSILYGIMPIFTKQVLSSGVTSQTVIFYRFLFACIFSLIFLTISKSTIKVSARQLIQLIFFGIVGFGMTAFLLSSSYIHIPVGLATMFHFSYPLFVTIFMILIYKEKASVMKFAVISANIIGIVFLMDFTGKLSVTGIILSMLSAVTYAVYVISSKKSSFAGLDSMVVIFYVTLFSSVFFGIQSAVTGTFTSVTGIKNWAFLLIIALFCTVISLYLLLIGIKNLGASNASMLNMIEPLTGIVAGAVFFSEKLGVVSIIGCILVLLSTILVTLDSKINKNNC